MRYLIILSITFFSITSCAVFKKSANVLKKDQKKKQKDEEPFKSWDKVLKDAEKMEGFFTLYQKEDLTLYAEIPPERLKKNFGMIMHINQGLGVLNLHEGLPLTSNARLMRFRKVGHKVQLVHRNIRFRADAGPMRKALKENIGHSVVHSFDIVSKNDSTGHLLINLTDFLVSDYANIAERVKGYFGNTAPSFQEDKSYVDSVMVFRKNVEINTALTYKGAQPPIIGGEAIPDYRSIPVGVRYSFFRLPKQPMQSRVADDRVGYFLNAVKDFSKDKQANPYTRYIQRWQLRPSDTAAFKRGELVEPVEPIVFYIGNSVPKEYRPYVKKGIEGWNEAFRKAGYKNAVVAKPAPDDSSWSAEDIRYSTIRWTAAHQMGYAIGPSQTDPRTGEILNADILISSEFIRGWIQEYQHLSPEVSDSESKMQRLRRMRQLPEKLRQMFSPEIAARACWYEAGLSHQIGLQRTVMLARGKVKPGGSLPDEYLGAAIRDLVLHEVGHTLGLRHNFKSSSAIKTKLLHDSTYTRKHGVSASVMDYAPVNIALNKNNQGYYWNPGVGPYDEWAIKYGYMPIVKQSEEGPLTRKGRLADTLTTEIAGLDKIAAQSSDSLHVYGTDEDNWLGPYAVDPLTNAWILGSNPVKFAEQRTRLVHKVMPKLEDRLIAEGERYHQLREATTSLLFERVRSLMPVTKMVGGMYVARDHKGTPDARIPFRPVSAKKQRKAVNEIIDNLFAPDAFQFDPIRLNKLAPNRYYHWGSSLTLQIDYPVHDYVKMAQSVILDELLHPARLKRMLDNMKRVENPEAAYTPGELLKRLTGAIWAELDGGESINSFRRNLQRIYTNRLIDFMLNTKSWITITFAGAEQLDAPGDVRSLARLELNKISERIEQALNRYSYERNVRAHLLEMQTRVNRALRASVHLEP